ncbi:MAG: TraR/DksA C4-type zinc finger protein [Brumimicrobium sp.]
MVKKQIEKIIDREIEKTIEDITEYKELTKPESPDVAIGRVSRMDAINNRSVLEAALRKSEERLRGLKYVKENINDESFGKCAGCGQEIPLKRIFIRPESRYCVRCAQ